MEEHMNIFKIKSKLHQSKETTGKTTGQHEWAFERYFVPTFEDASTSRDIRKLFHV